MVQRSEGGADHGDMDRAATVYLRPSFENDASSRVTELASVFHFKAGPAGIAASSPLSLALNTAYGTLTYKRLTSFVWSFGASSFVSISKLEALGLPWAQPSPDGWSR